MHAVAPLPMTKPGFGKLGNRAVFPCQHAVSLLVSPRPEVHAVAMLSCGCWQQPACPPEAPMHTEDFLLQRRVGFRSRWGRHLNKSLMSQTSFPDEFRQPDQYSCRRCQCVIWAPQHAGVMSIEQEGPPAPDFAQ